MFYQHAGKLDVSMLMLMEGSFGCTHGLPLQTYSTGMNYDSELHSLFF